jgi:CRP/FNR family transcriptional regulator, cyclic AMP receptor protein
VKALDQRIASLAHSGALASTVLVLPRRGHIYNCGDSGESLFLIERGLVKTTRHTTAGRSCLLRVHGPGEMFGECAFSRALRTDTAIAMCTTAVRRIPVAAFLAVLGDHDLLGDYVCRLAERIAEQQDVITDFATLPSENRLAATLLLLGRTIGVRMPGAGGVRLAGRINYQELADMVGTTRSRIGRFVQRFSAEDCVRLDKGILVLLNTDELAVRARHSLPPA